MSKYLFLDLETTGTKFWKNGIHQISGIIEVDNKIEERFNFHVKPFHRAVIEDEALAISGIHRGDLEDHEHMPDVYKKLTEILSKYVDKFNKQDKFFLIAYNGANFDIPFFRAFFVQSGDNYFGSWFWTGCIDVLVLALDYLQEERKELENFKLMTVAKHLEIDVDEEKAHDAMYDVEVTRKMYQIIKRRQSIKKSA